MGHLGLVETAQNLAPEKGLLKTKNNFPVKDSTCQSFWILFWGEVFLGKWINKGDQPKEKSSFPVAFAFNSAFLPSKMSSSPESQGWLNAETLRPLKLKKNKTHFTG